MPAQRRAEAPSQGRSAAGTDNASDVNPMYGGLSHPHPSQSHVVPARPNGPTMPRRHDRGRAFPQVRDCVLVSNDFAIGSECSGGCEGIVLRDTLMSDDGRNRLTGCIDVLRVKSATA